MRSIAVAIITIGAAITAELCDLRGDKKSGDAFGKMAIIAFAIDVLLIILGL